MTKEQLEKGNAISEEINILRKYKDLLSNYFTCGESICIKLVSSNKGDMHVGYKYNSCPEFLKEFVKEETEHVIERAISKVEKQIAKLEKELAAI